MSAGTRNCLITSDQTHTGALYKQPSCGILQSLGTLGICNVGAALSGPKLKKGASSTESGKVVCYDTGPVNTYQFNNQSTFVGNSSTTNMNQWRSNFTKFSSDVTATKVNETEMNYTEEQDITIENNIDIKFSGTYNIGMMRDGATLTVKGFDITNKFSFNLTTGATNLGTRTIQTAGQTSNVKSGQKTTWGSKTGMDITNDQTAKNKTKMSASMVVAFGPNGNAVFGMLVFAFVALIGLWIWYCRTTYMCRDIGLPGKICPPWDVLMMRVPNFTKMSKGKRNTEIRNQLKRCTDIIKDMPKKDREEAQNTVMEDMASIFPDRDKFGAYLRENAKVGNVYGIPLDTGAKSALLTSSKNDVPQISAIPSGYPGRLRDGTMIF
jgi:hypothetical protein